MIDTHCHFVSARLSHNVSRCCKIASKRSGKRTTSLPFVGDTSRRYYGTMASVEICPTCGRPLRPQDARNRSIAEQYKAGQTIYSIARTGRCIRFSPAAWAQKLYSRFIVSDWQIVIGRFGIPTSTSDRLGQSSVSASS